MSGPAEENNVGDTAGKPETLYIFLSLYFQPEGEMNSTAYSIPDSGVGAHGCRKKAQIDVEKSPNGFSFKFTYPVEFGIRSLGE